MDNQPTPYLDAFSDWHTSRFGCAPADAPAAPYRYEGWVAAQACHDAEGQLEICDRNGHHLQAGDVVIGHHGYVRNDGYLPKAAPDTIRALLEVYWNRTSAAFELRPVDVHPDDLEWALRYPYRRILYELKVSSGKDAKGRYAGPRTDMVCESLERLEPGVAKAFLVRMIPELKSHQVSSYPWMTLPA
jgi:hypothetical protein